MASEKQPRSLKDALRGKLTAAEMGLLVKSFDSMGNIAVIEIPDALMPKRRLIAEALLHTNKSIKTVLRISGKHSGEFRVQPVKYVAGEKTTIAHYKESGCRFVFDVSKTFFSPRLSTERLRIAKLIKKPEVVGAFFAGVGPFPIVFAKNSPMQKAYAVELNHDAVEMMRGNIALNKVQQKIEVIEGDVKKVAVTTLRGMCDRIVMPMPHTGYDFLEESLQAIKPSGGVVHFYEFVERDSMYQKPLGRIKAVGKKLSISTRVQRKAVVRAFSPAKVQVVVDFKCKKAK